jgi:hypothetical protein
VWQTAIIEFSVACWYFCGVERSEQIIPSLMLVDDLGFLQVLCT